MAQHRRYHTAAAAFWGSQAPRRNKAVECAGVAAAYAEAREFKQFDDGVGCMVVAIAALEAWGRSGENLMQLLRSLAAHRT